MGKYMRKSKAAGDVAATEVAQSSLGVRTRAKTLALRRMQLDSGGSYLQLRSRKLEKQLPVCGSRKLQSVWPNPCLNFKTRANSRLRVSPKLTVDSQVEGAASKTESENLKDCDEIGVAFFGENSPDFHAVDRGTRESTPCSILRDPDHVITPSSATKPSSSKRLQNSSYNILMSTAKEMEEFFAGAERQQHKQFIKKYNFDPANEQPLPGRYDWEKTDPPHDSPTPLFSGKN